MADAGKIAPTYDGEWSADKTYDFHTYVTHNNNCYIAKQPSTGVEPTEEDNAYWFLALKNVSAEELSNLQKLIEAIISGTTTVGNANKLGGKGANEYALQSAVDSIQTRNSKAFTTNGWYRIARIPTCDENYCKLVIVKQWASVGSETHVIEYVQTHSNRVLISTSDNVTSRQAIKKARVATEGNYRYIEIYYNANSVDSNRIAWSVVDNASINATDRWQTIDAVLTSETVDGVTVEATYDIPANASPVTDLDLEEKALDTLNLKMLGYTVPNEMPVQNYVDSNSIFHQRVGRVDLGSLGWDIAGESNNSFYTVLPFIKNDGKLYCSKYVTRDYYVEYGNFKDKSIYSHGNSPLIKDSTYTDATTFKNAMQGVYLYYELEEEKTISVDGNEAIVGLEINKADKSALANYLPLSGGTVTGAFAPMIFNRNESGAIQTAIGFSLHDSLVAYIGAKSNGELHAYKSTQQDLGQILHTGNSAKVAIQSSAPSDTSALWVDTANKVIKTYIDGAWTQVS